MNLDCSWLKNVVGGQTVVDGRIIYSEKTFKFIWQAGFILISNENDLPKFDPSDAAFMQLMVVSPCRSKFVTHVRDTYLQENTFAADLSINQQFDDWRGILFKISFLTYAVLQDSNKIPFTLQYFTR